MEPEATESAGFFKLLTWLHTNLKQLIIGVVVVVLIGAIIAFVVWRKNQAEIDASEALFAVPTPFGPAAKNATTGPEPYLKVANEYANTHAAQEALLLAATELFAQGKFADAQAQFEKILKEKGDGPFAAQSALGIAATLHGQGKVNDAIAKYQEVISKYAGDPVASQAKLTLANIFDSQNKPDQALRLFDELIKPMANDMWTMEAREGREYLLMRHPELAKTNAPAAAVMPTVPTNMVRMVTNAAKTNVVRTNAPILLSTNAPAARQTTTTATNRPATNTAKPK
jgi:predicted negative regulator of RcsB-dependent stress response